MGLFLADVDFRHFSKSLVGETGTLRYHERNEECHKNEERTVTVT